MLGVPEKNFKGGNFIIKSDSSNNDTIVTAKPEQFGGILFDSNKDHGVDTILEGERLVLVIEFWAFTDTRTEQKRPGIPPSANGYLVPEITRLNDILGVKNKNYCTERD